MLNAEANDGTWNFIGAHGNAVMGSGFAANDPSERIPSDLRPFEEDVVVQLETLDGVMRMWAWKHDDQPSEDVAPLIEEDFDLFDAFPIIWNRSIDGPSSSAFRWIAISTEHMPVNMPVPLSNLSGDFSGNDILNITDIDLLAAAIQITMLTRNLTSIETVLSIQKTTRTGFASSRPFGPARI